ncbi:DUF6268 family outer membrane beta-barrel protein [Rhizosphaericola mali]|uniref:DUF6268 domain-containing protein n=1 Tax=Rhizosphaericola mali TaxID=2545455 RepID=A0A5P2G2P9_9BACT|nr:DUF6268 family outer membrane beta-barrel protein [Rhizosphaericola mali]QES88092.1 hypothetical protein E0W69_005235 [Rhizosphaericola mali]
MHLKNIFTLLISFLIFSISAKAQLQELPFFGVNYNTGKLKNDTSNGNNKAFSAFMNIPVVHSDKRTVGVRLQYQNQTISGLGSLLDHRLQLVDANIYWRRKIADNKWLHFFGQAGIYSDFKDISGKDYRFMLGGIYTVKHSERLTTGWGINYARQFFGNQINPFVAINYDINDRWKLAGLLPINPILTFKINDHFSWSNELNAKVESYRLSAIDNDNGFIQTKGWRGISQLKYTIKKHHQFAAGIGYNFRQDISYFNNAPANDWKIFTFNLSNHNKAVQTTQVKGVNFNIGYSFMF